MPRRLRRLLVLAGVAGVLAAWRNRMLAANEPAHLDANRRDATRGQVTPR